MSSDHNPQSPPPNPDAPAPSRIDAPDSATFSLNLDQSQPSASYPSTATAPPPLTPAQADVRVPWGWLDIGLFLIFYIVAILVATVVVMGASMAALHLSVDALKSNTTLVVIMSIIGQALGSLAAMIYLWLMTLARGSRSFWSTMGWHPLSGSKTELPTVLRYIVFGFFLALFSSIVSSLAGEPKNVPFNEFLQSRQTIWMLMAFGILVAPLVEETMFRGFLYPVAARSFGVVWGIIATGILFGGSHASQLRGAWAQIAVLMFVGIALTWIRARAHSVFASFLVHVAYNSTLFAALLISTHGLKVLPQT